ncbi:hypothetical protein LXL04_021182 [Taraxacum kok-saghyz]
MLFLSLSTANSLIYIECSQPDFTMMTPYESNINYLFNTLLDSASISNFNKSIICYPESSQSDAVYGLFQCRNDLSSSNCKDCVANSLSQLKTTCPTSTSGKIQLDGCFVKYNITSFFGVVDNMEVSKRCGPSVYNSDVLSRIDDALVLLTSANGQYFRGGGFGSVQGVAQCVQDLTINECEDCLLEAYRRLRSECETSSSADMYLGNCYIRYADQDNHDDNNTCDCNDDDNHRSKRKKKNRMPPSRINIKTFEEPESPEKPIKVTTKDPSPPSTPSPPAGHYCNVVGGCTCPIPPPFTQAFYGQRNEIYGIPWLR